MDYFESTVQVNDAQYEQLEELTNTLRTNRAMALI